MEKENNFVRVKNNILRCMQIMKEIQKNLNDIIKILN